MNIQEWVTLLFGAGSVTTALGWFLERKRRKAETNTVQIENAKNLLSYYENLIEKLGERALKSEERAEQADAKFLKAIQELHQATEELEKARKTIKELETTVQELTTELTKYKQLNGKAK
ncbi:hypothetical protein CAPN002_23730 [Capnocytophaga stomatis]|uniref:hypothetical protein n=1 Tax=Capnocytophaga stomatis TaxID=1848904 RepID=UPI001950DC43|nr:hypothetical protein [Capnocytophaga stomatis]GIJ95155.1 hypothetical protein CAPN002_23730 [Capnocytophaga stomatis]